MSWGLAGILVQAPEHAEKIEFCVFINIAYSTDTAD